MLLKNQGESELLMKRIALFLLTLFLCGELLFLMIIYNVRISQEVPRYEHVVIIGVDGAGAFFKQASTPNMDRIFANGATTYEMRMSMPSASAEGWGSILHGVKPEFHNLTNERAWHTPFPIHSPYPSVFLLLHVQRPNATAASFACWNSINVGIIEQDIGVYKDTAQDDVLTTKIEDYLDTAVPNLMFVHFNLSDSVGEEYGFGSSEHLAVLADTDVLIGRIYDKYGEIGVLDQTLFLVTSDHGGTPDGRHGGDSDAEMNVFFGASGAQLVSGTIGACEGRDVAAIAAAALGLRRPETWTGCIPGNLFLNVDAEERQEMELPIHPFRAHQAKATPDVNDDRFITNLLERDKWQAAMTFDGHSKNVEGLLNAVGHGEITYQEGYYGQAASLENGYVTLENAIIGSNNFTVAAWIKTNGEIADPILCSAKNWSSGQNDGFALALCDTEYCFNVAGGSNERVDIEPNYPLDIREGWSHLLVSVDREARTVIFYVDFIKYYVDVLPESFDKMSFSPLTFNIGQDATGEYPHKLTTVIDEFLLYSDAMTDADIAVLANYYAQLPK